LKVPEKLDTMDLFTSAIAEKVAFVPGVSFFANGDVHNAMRLNFSCCKPEVINEGVSRLSKIIKKELVTK
jgi:2-aminoadipate transaminase